MRIEIGKYILKSDSMSFMLVKELNSKDKKGNPVEKVIGYYTTIESILKAVPERVLMASDAITLKELVVEVKKYREIIENGLI